MATNTSVSTFEGRSIHKPRIKRVVVENPTPFDPRVYSSPVLALSPLFDIPLAVEKGFPQVRTIQPWIPGVSTPEGLLLTASVSTLLLNAVANGGEAAIRAIEGAASAVFVLAITGIPTSVAWLSTQVLYPKK